MTKPSCGGRRPWNLDEVEGTPCANIRYRAAGLTGAAFCKTKRWEESLASLRLSLSYLQVTSSGTEIDIKSGVW